MAKNNENDDRVEEYSNLSLQQTDQVHRLPGVFGPELHIENELDAFGREQLPLWRAEGLVAARTSAVERASLDGQRWSQRRLARADMALVREARRRARHLAAALGPYVRRKPGQKRWFYIRTAALFGGDAVGQAGAQIMYGEVPELALLQAVAAGVAIVTAGLIGSEVKDLRMAARRRTDPDNLTPAQARFPHLFNGIDEGKHIVKAVVYTSATVGLMISTGIFGLRAFVDSPIAGLIYGSIAVGVAAASFVSSYVYADEAADAIDNAERAYEAALARQEKLAGRSVRVRADGAEATADSITAEYEQRARAAQVAHEGLKHRVLRRNPGVAGHSPALGPEPVIGSRPRPSEADS